MLKKNQKKVKWNFGVTVYLENFTNESKMVAWNGMDQLVSSSA